MTKKNYIYFLCLINWQTVLKSDELELIEKYIEKGGTKPKKIGDWIKIDLDWEKEIKEISKSELGFYHSRLIFKFMLKEPPKDIAGTRKIKEALRDKIREFLGDEENAFIEKIKEKANKPFIFYFPIFELDKRGEFWNRGEERPYSLQTTCFYTELHGLKRILTWNIFKRKRIKMRISGAQIITTNMKDWFFNTLVNIIFHEGLYRQTRDEKLNDMHKNTLIYEDLENMLEDFASRLMTIFHQYSSEYYRRVLQIIALSASIFGIGLGLLYFFLRTFLRI